MFWPFAVTAKLLNAGALKLKLPSTKFQFVGDDALDAFVLIKCNSSNVGDKTCNVVSPIFGKCNVR